jgi:branched-chain amino acid transport system ATP-binding protein
MTSVLETRDVTRHFGAVKAADHLNLQFQEGQIVGIVGPNGSGKTTFVNIITGHVKPAHGQVLYRGRDVTGLNPPELTKLGIARSFQIPQLYVGMSLLDNMLIALSIQSGEHWHFWQPLKTRTRVDEALQLLDQFGFRDNVERQVSVLPEGARKVLDVALSFALQPSLLLLDEPTSGVSAHEKFDVMDALVHVFMHSGITTVFVEHDMDIVARYAERVIVFADGSVLADGPPDAVFGQPEVRRHVLGEVS